MSYDALTMADGVHDARPAAVAAAVDYCATPGDDGDAAGGDGVDYY